MNYYIPEYNFGGWLKDNKRAVMGGLTTAAGATMLATGVGAPLAVPLLTAGVGQLASGIQGDQAENAARTSATDAKENALRQNAIQRAQNTLSSPQIPNFEMGGQFVPTNQYMGQTHQGPNQGIPIDSQGNPAIKTGKPVVGLTEDGEVNYGNYVFSNKLCLGGKIRK